MRDTKKLLLLVNSFLATDKFAEHYHWFCEAAGKRGIEMDIVGNADLTAAFGCHAAMQVQQWLSGYFSVIFWDKDIVLGRYLTSLCEKLSIPVYNSVEAVAVCDDKLLTYQSFLAWNLSHDNQEQIPMIPTVAAPMTYPNVGYKTVDFLERVECILDYPMVVKECFGSFGMQVYLAKDREMLDGLIKRFAGKPLLFQHFVTESAGRDLRLQVVGDRVVAGMHRYSTDGDFRANITNGGSMCAHTATEKECELAVRTVRALGLDFAGVDLLYSHGSGEADLVCEVNSNAHFKNIYTCTGVDVAQLIVDYILKKAGRFDG